ncbi:nuclear transport factor 2 family protein [Actinomycetospora sp. CA-053990]|uniref:nuclear transport factor 2 family protein n=1 Tax=Actinomycetospora sp. CA-053990 TaxID=3239891 RepID=UPI003D8E2CB5
MVVTVLGGPLGRRASNCAGGHPDIARRIVLDAVLTVVVGAEQYVVAVMFASCDAVDASPVTTTHSTNVDTVQGSYDAFNNGEIPMVLAAMQPDVEWVERAGPYQGRYVGPQAIVDNVFAPVPKDWSEFTVTPDEFLEAGDVIVVLGWFAGTARESGTSFRSRFAHVIRMRDGLEASFEDISDAHALHVALGH